MAAKSLPQIKIQNVGGVQTNVPFTLGHAFAPGDLAPTDGLTGGALPLQVDVKATHADGSVRHAILSGVLPKLAAGETIALQLAKAVRDTGPAVKFVELSEFPLAAVSVTVDGISYQAKTTDAGTIAPWLSGNIVGEWFAPVPLKNADGQEHPLLTSRFGVRYFPDAEAARVEFVIENTNTFGQPAQAFTYDVELQVAGKAVYSQKALRHFHHSRWHQYFWTGTTSQIYIQHDTAYLIATKAVANYDQSTPPAEKVLAAMVGSIGAGNTGPMSIGTVNPNMAMAGGRGDIGPLPDWAVNYLLSMDKRAYDVMMANADASGSLSMHYRDETTGYPVRTDNDKNARISLHQNMASTGPLPVPRFATDADGGSPYNVDLGHMPSLAFLPYLQTGDYYYLEEMQFLSAFYPIGTDPGYNGNGKGLLRWHQVRGQAWGLRSLGEAAAFTPDAHPLKTYFAQQLDNNLSFYAQTYVAGNPNNLGMYDGSGEGSATITGCAPWQDDFLTWSFSHLGELGFDKARPIAEWKAKFPVGRLVGEGFCYVLAAHYAFPFIRDDSGKIYASFKDLYSGNFYRDLIPTDGWELKPERKPSGVNWFDLPCGSQAQADFLGAINGYGWERGRMVGYADSVIGYLANMQPAAAAAADLGIPGADKAWALFAARKVQPDYTQNPQWNIIPRTAVQVAAPTVTPSTPAPISTAPVPVASTAAPLKIGAQPKQAGTWKKVGAENEKVSLPIDSQVRYGAEGKGYIYATTVVKEFQATNAVFGSDPAVNVVKQVDLFTASQPARLKTSANTLLKKLTELVVKVVDPKTLQIVSKFSGVTASSTGIITVSGPDLMAKAVYAVVVENAAGKVLDIMFPVTATA
jgi:hypothetical protein